MRTQIFPMSFDDLLVALHQAGVVEIWEKFEPIRRSPMGLESLKSLVLSQLASVPDTQENKDFWLIVLHVALKQRQEDLERSGRLGARADRAAGSQTVASGETP